MSSKEVSRLVKAVADPGPAPHIHYEEIRRLAYRWPTLARAIADVMRANDYANHIPHEWKRL